VNGNIKKDSGKDDQLCKGPRHQAVM